MRVRRTSPHGSTPPHWSAITSRHPHHRTAWALRLVRAVWATGWLLAALIAIPWLLLTLSRAALAALDTTTLVSQPITAPSVILAGTGIGWAVWACLLHATVVALTDRFQRLRRLRLPVPLHTAFSSLTGSLVLLTNTAAGHPDPTTAPTPVPTSGPAPRCTRPRSPRAPP